jgi:hypothetical protein
MEVTASQPIKLCKTMKKILMFLILCFVIVSNAAFSQIKVTSDGKVGLRNTNPAYPVDIVGNIAIRPSLSNSFLTINGGHSTFDWSLGSSQQYTGYIGYYGYLYGLCAKYVYASNILYSSDEKLKKNIRAISDALPVILKLRPVSFDYNIDYSNVVNEKLKSKLQEDDKNRIGFIAQEVQKLLPQSVKEKDSDSTLCIQLTDFIPLLIKGMQEQTAQIDSLKSMIDEINAAGKGKLKSATITGTDNMLNSNAILYQNTPNPFNNETKIGCYIPENSGASVLYIYTMNGTQLQQNSITGKGKQTITINGSSLEPGMYLYALVVDGKEVDTKRMILTK